MTEQKSAVGPVLLGCGLIGLLCVLVCAGVVVFFVPRMIEQAQ